MPEGKQEIKGINYKFKELKTYSSTEWLIDNSKKYRQVFDVENTSYIYAELSLYNKEFDKESWDLNVRLVCRDMNKRKQICSIDVNKQVSKNEPVIYVREGWGNKKKSSFWKKGIYCWEAWIDDVKIGTKYFYLEDMESWEADFQEGHIFKSMKLYEGNYNEVIPPERIYMKKFSASETRYIHLELIIENIFLKKEWYAEIFIKFFNEVKELKGQIVKLHKVNVEDTEIDLSAGWGSNLKGSWREGSYTAEVIFMDQLIGIIPFEIGDEFEEGVSPILLPKEGKSVVLHPGEENHISFKEVMSKLDALIGLDNIKKQVKDHASYLKFIKLRKEKGFLENSKLELHSVFTGNPGTGKTTVAKMMGLLYHKMGFLSKGHVVEVDRADLVGEYIGQTAPKVKAVLQKAQGGVLFIDEAYALARASDDNKDFGREVVELLVKEMSSNDGDMAIIVAGYPNEMKIFIDSNPGLRSRFKHYFNFKDYTPDELMSIANYMAQEREVELSESAIPVLDDIIQESYRSRNRSFGNARFIGDLLDKSKINLGLRIMARKNPNKLSKQELSVISAEDIRLSKPNTDENRLLQLRIDEALLKDAMEELNSLIGISNVKKQIKETINVVKYYIKTGKITNSSFSMHTVLIGNPGTGKSTVARILSKIYKALGILERGHLVETDRQGLVAGFIGQTAIKTKERIDEAMGGVLFIDEAYSLSNSNGLQGDYGNEAIQTLLKEMEDNRGKFYVFVAGYPENMKHFLNANPGLSSRFDKTLVFEDYDLEHLMLIAEKMISDKGYSLKKQAKIALNEILSHLYKTKNKHFGNARVIRKMILDIIKHQNLRIADNPDLMHNKRKSKYIEFEDVVSAKDVENEIFDDRKRISFRQS
ncbi:MAG TPA: AAA family ATPase [Saprospiraceae bacterium]|nr:AAA family ATPase [Saprospiraceae bacterium]